MNFVAELRLARLALDPNNTPAWEVPELDLKPATKMPLFVGDHCISSTHPKSDVSKIILKNSLKLKTNEKLLQKLLGLINEDEVYLQNCIKVDFQFLARPPKLL